MLSPRAIAAITLIATSTCPAMAENYSSNPAGTLELGAGVNPSDLTVGYIPCIVDPSQEWLSASNHAVAVPKTEFSSQILTDYEDVYKAFDLDASLSASYLFTSGKADFHLADSSALHSDSFSWTLKARSDYGWKELGRGYHLDSTSNELINRPHDFYKRCGTEYVQKEHRVAEVIAVFTVHHLSSSQRNELSGSGSGALSGPVSLSADSSFRNFFSKASGSGATTISIYAIGGHGIKELSPIVGKPDDLDTVLSTMKAYVDTLNVDSAAAVDWTTGHFESFGAAPSGISFPRRPELAELYYAYVDYQQQYQRLGQIVRGSGGDYAYLSPSQLDNYNSQYSKLDEYLKDIKKNGVACLDHNRNCHIPALPADLRISWPSEPLINCTRWVKGVCYWYGSDIWCPSTGSKSLGNSQIQRVPSVRI